jgi:uncharacterized protein YxjI
VEFQYDRYLVDQLIRPIANLYRVTPLAAGEAPAGPPIAFVRQRTLAIKEDVRFYADEGETRELFRIAARSMLDIGGSRYDVVAPRGDRIGFLWHKFRESLLRTTWHIGGPNEEELALARERSFVGAVLRRGIDFVPDIGGWIPIPYNFEFLIDGAVVGGMGRKFQLRDTYILDLSGDPDKKIDRRVAIALAVALDALQNR